MTREMGLRCDLVGVCRRLYARGFIAATDGNVSCRAGADRLLITPSGSAKGELQPTRCCSLISAATSCGCGETIE